MLSLTQISPVQLLYPQNISKKRRMWVPQRTITLDLKAVTFAILILWCFGDSKLNSVPQSSEQSLLQDSLVALIKAIDFFEEDVADVNLDGLHGGRVCQGAIMQALSYCLLRCPSDLSKILSEVNDRFNQIGDKALPYIEAQDPLYFYRFRKFVEEPFIVSYLPEQLGNWVPKFGIFKDYEGNLGDDCVANLAGTYVDNKGSHLPCTITEECWHYMTAEGTSGYTTTHQALYFIWGEKLGCLRELENMAHVNGTSVRSIVKHLCGNIYSEVKSESLEGEVGGNAQDLFLEQIMVCGLLGFQEFLTEKWLKMIMKWQNAKGCYNLNPDLSKRSTNENMQSRSDPLDTWPRRKILREKAMNGDCLSHKTGLGIATLGVYVRHLVYKIYLH